ncbi:hypothetical protein PMAYCL1PPCAC_28667, partial [Pristionchus mayeri]
LLGTSESPRVSRCILVLSPRGRTSFPISFNTSFLCISPSARSRSVGSSSKMMILRRWYSSPSVIMKIRVPSIITSVLH